MKPSSLIAVAAVVLLTLQQVDALFLTSLALLPISAIVSLGGIGGLKLAVVMKILDMLGWWDVGRYGVDLRASIENNKLPDRVVPLPKPRSSFSGPTISVPIALLPYIIGGRVKSPLSVQLPVKDFIVLANQSAHFESSKVKFSSEGAASVNGTKGSSIRASGELRSPLVNVEAHKSATLRGRRSTSGDPRVIKETVGLIRELDTDRCMLRLSCEVSADPSSYGLYGRRVAAFMGSLGPVGSDSAFADFEKAYSKGRSSGMAGCTKTYSTCKFDLRALAALVESS